MLNAVNTSYQREDQAPGRPPADLEPSDRLAMDTRAGSVGSSVKQKRDRFPSAPLGAAQHSGRRLKAAHPPGRRQGSHRHINVLASAPDSSQRRARGEAGGRIARDHAGSEQGDWSKRKSSTESL